MSVFVFAGDAPEETASQCTTIQDGTLLRSDGEPIVLGFDEWGYNYQGHFFEGGYCDAYRDAVWCQPYKEIHLIMKWNDAWLSNKDCDRDGLLDRYFGYDSYIGSGAWETNTMTGSYELEDGKECNWAYFTKIIAVPEDAYLEENIWYTADDLEIGPDIWGSFAVLFEVSTDSCTEDHGVFYRPEVPIGFGFWDGIGN